jgi:hypothetical protein
MQSGGTSITAPSAIIIIIIIVVVAATRLPLTDGIIMETIDDGSQRNIRGGGGVVGIRWKGHFQFFWMGVCTYTLLVRTEQGGGERSAVNKSVSLFPLTLSFVSLYDCCCV